MTTTRAARPVLKWAGGKSRTVPHILARLPDRIATFYEPFVGGAAVFFALAGAGRFKKAVLSDRNRDLVEVYLGIQKDVESLIRILEGYKDAYSEDEYYRIRELDPGNLDPIERAARLIYLNKTGYNGLYRVNRAGRFNVPFGRHRKPKICDPPNLRAAAAALARVKLRVEDFADASKRAKAGDVVYFDPPYVPVSKTASFTAYHHEAFGPEDHTRLADVFEDLAQRNVTALLSNSDTPETRRLYRGWRVDKIPVSRPINSKGQGRGVVDELLVVNIRKRR